MKDKVLYKTELVHPIFLMLFVAVFSGLLNFSLFELKETNIIELLPTIIIVIASYFALNILNTSQVVAIKNSEIVKGIYCLPFGFLKIQKRIKISNIKDIKIKQNKKSFYEITAESSEGNSFVIKSIANKNPAEKERNRIKTEIKTFKFIKTN